PSHPRASGLHAPDSAAGLAKLDEDQVHQFSFGVHAVSSLIMSRAALYSAGPAFLPDLAQSTFAAQPLGFFMPRRRPRATNPRRSLAWPCSRRCSRLIASTSTSTSSPSTTSISTRSEERRVGKECRSRCSPDD